MMPTSTHAGEGRRGSWYGRSLHWGLGLAILVALSGCGRPTTSSKAVSATSTSGSSKSDTSALSTPAPPLPKPQKLPRTKNSLGMELVQVPAGEFKMGSPETDGMSNPDERPVHRQRIERPFWLAIHEVTVGQYRKFVDATGHLTAAELSNEGGYAYHPRPKRLEPDPKASWRYTGFDQDETHPVVNLTWNDAQAFCKWLSKEEKVTYRLPTEAEWEYACRATTTTIWSFGADQTCLAGKANICDVSLQKAYPFAKWSMDWSDGYAFTAPVGTFEPNAFGLYDMHGNVFEWCSDAWDGKDYAGQFIPDPDVPDIADTHVLRGGSYLSLMMFTRSADRVGLKTSQRNAITGFRVARDVDDSAPPGEKIDE